MKLSHLKTIIKESIKELQNNKSPLNEAEVCEYWASPFVEFDCPEPPGGTGMMQTYRKRDCSWHTASSGCRGNVRPGGGGRAPMGPTMG